MAKYRHQTLNTRQQTIDTRSTVTILVWPNLGAKYELSDLTVQFGAFRNRVNIDNKVGLIGSNIKMS